MKKIVSLIAAVSMLFALSTSAFAFSGTVSGDATLEGTTISVGAEGLIFKFIGSEEIKGGSVVKVNLSTLVNDGWTIEQVNGAWCEDTDNTQSSLNTSNLLQVKYAAGSTYDVTDQVMLQFKAIPGSTSTIDGYSFQIQPTISKVAGGLYNTKTTYNLVKAADSDDEVTADKTAGDENTDYDTYTFENLEAGSALEGKKVLMQKAAASTTGMTDKTRFVVKSSSGREQIFGGDIWSRLGGVEGGGTVSVSSVIFGLIVDADSTETFEFTVDTPSAE